MPHFYSCVCGAISEKPKCPKCSQDAAQADRQSRAVRTKGFYNTAAWRRLAAACKRRDGNRCVRCQGTTRLAAHHKIPRTAGGPDTLDNLVTLCGPCHSALEAHLRAGSAADFFAGNPANR